MNETRNERIVNAVKQKNVKLLLELTKDGFDVSYNNYEAFSQSLVSKDVTILRFFYSHADEKMKTFFNAFILKYSTNESVVSGESILLDKINTDTYYEWREFLLKGQEEVNQEKPVTKDVVINSAIETVKAKSSFFRRVLLLVLFALFITVVSVIVSYENSGNTTTHVAKQTVVTTQPSAQ